MLEVKNLKKTYRPRNSPEVKALDGVSLSFPEKGLVFILGKSGSGKSTLLHVMGGLDTADSGEIVIKNKSSAKFTQGDFDSYRNTFVGFIFQEYNVLDEFTVGANIGLALELQNKKATEEKVAELLHEVGLDGLGDRKPNELSGGQKQRVAIARALIKEPEIIMADEPTGALDSKTGQQVFDTLKSLSKTRLVIVVSHDREFAEQFGDRVIELADGKVIGDITKKISEDSAGPDVAVVSDKFIRIRKGTLLTEKDLVMINEYLKNKKSDTVIPIESQTDGEVKKLLRFEDSAGGKVGTFANTTPDMVEKSEYRESDFKMIKSRLPFKNALKMGASGLKHKRIRLAISIILASIAFSLFGVADTIGSFNAVASATRTMKDQHIDYVSVGKSFGEKRDSYYQDTEFSFSEKELEDLNKTYGGNFRLATANQISLYNNMVNDSQSRSILPQQLSGAIEVDETLIKDAGLELIGNSKLPKENEILISLFNSEHFVKYGYRDHTDFNGKKQEIAKPEDMIGKTLSLNGSADYVVSGVVDTHFPRERYERILQIEDENLLGNDMQNYMILNDYQSTYKNGYHTIAFLAKGELETFAALTSNDKNQYYISDKYVTNSYAEVAKEGAYEISFFKDQTSLAENEMAVYMPMLTDMNMQLSQDRDDYFRQYINDNIEAYDPIFQDVNEAFHRLMYGEWYLESPDKSGLELDKEFAQLYYTEPCKISARLGHGGEIEVGEFKVVGLIVSDPNIGKSFVTAILPSSAFSVLPISSPYNRAISANTLSEDKLNQLFVQAFERPDEGFYFKVYNEVSSVIYSVGSQIDFIAQIFLYIGLGFAVFAGLLMLSFITTSISFKRREIGILRAVGARGRDVFLIFFNESAIIALINFVLAAIITAVVVPIFSGLIAYTGMTISLFAFGIRQVGLLLAVSLFVAFVSSFFPVYNIARKKPIEAIRNK